MEVSTRHSKKASSPCSIHKKLWVDWDQASHCSLLHESASWTQYTALSESEKDALKSHAPPLLEAGLSAHHDLVCKPEKHPRQHWGKHLLQCPMYECDRKLTSVQNLLTSYATHDYGSASSGHPEVCCPHTDRSEWGAQTCCWTPGVCPRNQAEQSPPCTSIQ